MAITHIKKTVTVMPKTIKDFLVFRRERENPQTNESIATIKEVKSIKYIISKNRENRLVYYISKNPIMF